MPLLAETKRVLDYLVSARIPGRTIRPEDFGAVGDGVKDDTRALLDMIAASKPGDRYDVAGVYCHGDIPRFSRLRTSIGGGGTLLATNPQASSVWITGGYVTMEDLTLRKRGITERLYGIGDMGLRIGDTTTDGLVNPIPADYAIVRRVHIEGAGAAGLYYCGGSGYGLLEDVTVSSSLADGIHMTEGVHDLRVINPKTSHTGDDGIAVVSYTADKAVVRNIEVSGAHVLGNTHSRGMTVIGGEDVTYRNSYIRGTTAAGIVVSGESKAADGFDTHAPKRVRIDGAVLEDVNRGIMDGTGPDHGAVLVTNDQTTETLDDVTFNNVSITDCHNGFRSVGVYSASNVRFRNTTFSGRQGWNLWHSDNLGAVTRENTVLLQTSLASYGLDPAGLPTDPNGQVTAVPGSTAAMKDGSLWIKESGTDAQGWAQVGASASAPPSSSGNVLVDSSTGRAYITY